MKTKSRKADEYTLQKNVCIYLDLQYKDVFYNGSAGGQYQKYVSQRVKNKACGYKSGFPDLFIYEPRKIDGVVYHGLALELKVKPGRSKIMHLSTSDDQVCQFKVKWLDVRIWCRPFCL